MAEEASAKYGDWRRPAHISGRSQKARAPELQAEIEFGILQSSETTAREILENFKVFLEHDDAWQDANDTILEMCSEAEQEDFPAMDELADVVAKEIGWQTAMWNEDYERAHDAARDVLPGLSDIALGKPQGKAKTSQNCLFVQSLQGVFQRLDESRVFALIAPVPPRAKLSGRARAGTPTRCGYPAGSRHWSASRR